jgi:hypothetical protein
VASLLSWIEQSALGHVVREAGPWAYPLINLAHILGIATLFGAVVAMDLSLLGVGRRSPAALSAIVAAAAPVARAGFLLAALSGVALLATNATEYVANPFLLVKFPVIALGLANALLVNRSPAWRALRDGTMTAAERRRLAVGAAISLACWTTAVGAGRMIGYW